MCHKLFHVSLNPSFFTSVICSECAASPGSLAVCLESDERVHHEEIDGHPDKDLVRIRQALGSPSAFVGWWLDRQAPNMYSSLSHYGFATSGCKHSKAEEPECVYPEGMNSALVAFAEFDCFHLCLTMLTGAAWHQQERRLIHNCVPWVSVGNSLLHNIDHCRASSQSLPFLSPSPAPGPNNVYV